MDLTGSPHLGAPLPSIFVGICCPYGASPKHDEGKGLSNAQGVVTWAYRFLPVWGSEA